MIDDILNKLFKGNKVKALHDFQEVTGEVINIYCFGPSVDAIDRWEVEIKPEDGSANIIVSPTHVTEIIAQ